MNRHWLLQSPCDAADSSMETTSADAGSAEFGAANADI